MTYLNEKDVKEWNREQFELRKDLPCLFIAMKQAREGNPDNLDLHILRKRIIEYIRKEKKIHEYIIFMDKRLNDLLFELKKKYCDQQTIRFTKKYNGRILEFKNTKKVFDSEEIESMLINYIMTFPYGFVEVYEGIYDQVRPLEDFIGENDEHSNNKLIKYITESFEKQVVIRRMNKELNAKRMMINGRKYNVIDNIDITSFNDITISVGNNGDENLNFTEIAAGDKEEHHYGRTKEFDFIIKNFRDILTENQLEKFDRILDAVNNGEIEIDELFHNIRENELKIDTVGKILFPEKSNSYWQPSVRNMLKSMQKRMNKALKENGFNEVEIISDYIPFPALSKNENKKYIDYNISSKYIIKDFAVENNTMFSNVKFYKDEQVIPKNEIDNIKNEKMTVTELINKYKIDVKQAKSKDGALYYFRPSRNGNVIISNEERQRLFNNHCRTIFTAILEGKVKFVNRGNWMIPVNTNKLNPLTLAEYDFLINRLLINFGKDNKEMDIIKKRVNLKYFNIGSHHELLDKKYIFEKQRYKYINKEHIVNNVKML